MLPKDPSAESRAPLGGQACRDLEKPQPAGQGPLVTVKQMIASRSGCFVKSQSKLYF